jgi:hypothetical protein
MKKTIRKNIMTHDELTLRAVRWLRKTRGCSVVFSELVTAASNEIPDAIGWRYAESIMVECKASRSDFHRDMKKPRHAGPDAGVGSLRYYMAPKGLLKAEDMPEGWGLLDVTPKRVFVTVVATRRQVFNRTAEAGMLCSAVRRHQHRDYEWLSPSARFRWTGP